MSARIRQVVEFAETQRESGFQSQRDRLAHALRNVLAQNEGIDRPGKKYGGTVAPGIDTAAEASARTVLVDIYGE